MSFRKRASSFQIETGILIARNQVPSASPPRLRCARRSLGSTGAGEDSVSWTGANEKTVKNWFSGRYGPSGGISQCLLGIPTKC